jgi:hypothetical protein
VVVDLVLKASVTGVIGPGLTLQHDGATARHDQAGPDQQDTRLAERNLAVVDADQPGPLRNK